MKFQIGDRVLILHSNEEGEVIDIINNKMVMVDVRGVKFPAYIDQLDFPYFKKFSANKLFSNKKSKKYIDDVKKEKAVPKVSDGVWITFLAVFAIYAVVGVTTILVLRGMSRRWREAGDVDEQDVPYGPSGPSMLGGETPAKVPV